MDYTKYCALTFNGVLLDKEIDGYQTINVEGRGLKSKSLDITEIPGRNGTVINGSKFKENILIVHFSIKSKNDKEKRKTLDEMNKRLHSNEDVVFSFGDEMGYRIGRIGNVNNPPYNQLEGVGSFEIYCQYPFRILETVSKTASTQYTINYPEALFLEYEKITITPSTTEEVRIRNVTNGDVISLKNLDSNKPIIITKDSILQGGKNIVNKLDWTLSVWKSFRLSNSDVIQYQGGSVKFDIRGLML